MQIKNVTLSATTETEITIEQGYPYVWFKNLGDNTVYVSASPDILDNGSVKTEGVSTITSGECTSVTTKSDKVYAYALGATTIEVHAQGNPESSFKIQAKGGESSVTVEPILIKQNGEYTAPEGKAYSPVNVQTPVYNITPLTLTHNHQGAEAGLYGGYSPVEVQIEMDTLKAPANGVYEIDENTQDGWDTVLVDTYEKYKTLYAENANSYDQMIGLVDTLTADKYDEVYLLGMYAYGDSGSPVGNSCALWVGRYPIADVLSRGFIGAVGSDNYLWARPSTFDSEIKNYDAGSHSYDNPFMFIGVKNRDADRDTLWESSPNEESAPSSVTLSDSIFDYDEIILTFTTGYHTYESYLVTSCHLVSNLAVNDNIYAFGEPDSHVVQWEITSGTVLTKVTETNFSLYSVQGIKDASLEETTLFTNPSTSDIPATITLSQSYKNFDEICFVGHIASEGTDHVVTAYYPVKALTKGLDIAVQNRVAVFTSTAGAWMAVTSYTSLVPDTTSPAVIIDKIIGIKRPVVSTAHELIDVVPLTANSNGTYTAPSGTAYSPVTVDVVEPPWEPLEDGYSNFWFELTDDTLSPWLNFSAKNADAVIDWGDGSGEQSLDTLTPTHTYAKAGKYVVKVKGVTGIGNIFIGIVQASRYINTLINMELNSDVTDISAGAFSRCASLEHCVVSQNVIALLSNVFNLCSELRDITIPNSVRSINAAAFAYCTSLKDVTLSTALESIGSSVFSTCPIMNTITIPSTVSTIGNSAFAYCSSLSEIHVQATTPPTLGTTVFQSLPANYIIYVPVGTGDTYKAAAGWSAYADHILEEGQSVTRAMMSRLAKVDNDGDIMEAEKNEADDESSDMR